MKRSQFSEEERNYLRDEMAKHPDMPAKTLAEWVNQSGKVSKEVKTFHFYCLRNRIKKDSKKQEPPTSSQGETCEEEGFGTTQQEDEKPVTFGGLLERITGLAEYAQRLKKEQLRKAEQLFL